MKKKVLVAFFKWFLIIVIIPVSFLSIIVSYPYYIYPKFFLQYSVNEKISAKIHQHIFVALQDFNIENKTYVCIINAISKLPNRYFFLKNILERNQPFMKAYKYHVNRSNLPAISIVYFNDNDNDPNVIFIYQYDKRFINSHDQRFNKLNMENLSKGVDNFKHNAESCGLAKKMYLYDIKNPIGFSPEFFFITVEKVI